VLLINRKWQPSIVNRKSPIDNPMSLRATLRQGLQTLLAHHVPSAQLAAELLLMHVLGRDRAYLHTHADEELSPQSVERYAKLIAERLTGKPTQYITGHQEFWGLDFEVCPDVLIPRPETEHIVERVLELADRQGHAKDACLRIVDVGTGSGCIALALASEFPRATLFGTDISSAALAVASQNAAHLGMPERVKFLESDLLKRLLESEVAGTVDFVVSNPPYVGKHDVEKVQKEVCDFEPRLALGADLERAEEIYERLFPQALQALKSGGYVVAEIGFNMRDRVLALLNEEWVDIQVTPDLAGIPRVVSARKAPKEHF
jgi:release factor glutamine methyltransferase